MTQPPSRWKKIAKLGLSNVWRVQSSDKKSWDSNQKCHWELQVSGSIKGFFLYFFPLFPLFPYNILISQIFDIWENLFFMGCSSFPSLLWEKLAGAGSVEAARGRFWVVIFKWPFLSDHSCTCPWWELPSAPIWVYCRRRGMFGPAAAAWRVTPERTRAGFFLGGTDPKGSQKKPRGTACEILGGKQPLQWGYWTPGQAALRGCEHSAAENDQNSAQTWAAASAGPSLGAGDGPDDPEAPFNNDPMVLMPGGFLSTWSNYLAPTERNIGDFNPFFPILHLFSSTQSFLRINHVLLSLETIVVIIYRKNQHNSECFTP